MRDEAPRGSHDAERFVAGAAASVHPIVRGWYSATELHENVRAWLAPELRLLDDAEAAREFAAACPVPGRDASEYGRRVVRIGDGLDVVAGIRFRTSDGTTPWVDVVAPSRPVAIDEWTRVADVLTAEFVGFAPRWVGFWSAVPVDHPRRMPGDVVVAARVQDLVAGIGAADESVLLRRANAATSYDQYLGLYRAFHAEHPRNAELAHVEDVESMAQFESDGGLFEIRVDGFFAGYCGARRSSRFGVRGWLGGEIVLANRFRGHGHAASVHRRMAEAIPASPGDAIWATVHEDNAPSLRAGLRAGYADVGRVARIAV